MAQNGPGRKRKSISKRKSVKSTWRNWIHKGERDLKEQFPLDNLIGESGVAGAKVRKAHGGLDGAPLAAPPLHTPYGGRRRAGVVLGVMVVPGRRRFGGSAPSPRGTGWKFSPFTPHHQTPGR